MSDPNDWRRQLDALSQQYWNAWTSLASTGGPSPAAAPGAGPFGAFGAGAPGWPQALEFWSRLASPQSHDAQAAIGRFGKQAQEYLELMRTAAERVQQGAGAAEVAAAWRDALSASGGGNPLLDALSSLAGEGARGPRQLAEGAEALLAPLRGQMDALLSLPAFGQHREQQERMQQLARDQAALQKASNRYAALLLEASEQAFVLFEKKLAERSEPGRQLDSARALYDLWVDAAEEAYAPVALSPRFRAVFGELVNAQMRVRQGVQQQVERSCAELGMPTRSELDSTHRRMHDLQRELAELRQRLEAFEGASVDALAGNRGGAAPEAAASTTRKAAPKRAAKGASRAAPAKKAAAPSKKPKAAPAASTRKRSTAGRATGARAGGAGRAPLPAAPMPKRPAATTKRSKATSRGARK